jgi:arabinose-5-phosphate isomerase
MTDTNTLLVTGQRVLGIESAAIAALGLALDQQFTAAATLMLNTTGRVIVSGMGKSGHIARKIAATFASTGTPAYFVHPAEASHGDLGMLTSGDVVMMLSNSGETPELADMISYTRRFGISLIGVASRADSTLMREADIGLLLAPAPEACGTGIVPTTSTAMMLALGDAMAIALMEHRQFTPQDFRKFHPGGKLGAQLSKVSDLMHRGDEIPLVSADAPMSDVLLAMSRKGFGVVGVTGQDGALRGIITDGDLRRHMDGLLARTASEVMTSDPKTISPDALAEEAVAMMDASKITSLFAVPGDGTSKAVGFLNIHDCLRAGVV